GGSYNGIWFCKKSGFSHCRARKAEKAPLRNLPIIRHDPRPVLGDPSSPGLLTVSGAVKVCSPGGGAVKLGSRLGLVLGLGDDRGDALGEAGAGQVGRVAPDVAAVLPEVAGAEGEAEVGVQVGGFAGAGVGGDVENLDVDGDGGGFGGGEGVGGGG